MRAHRKIAALVFALALAFPPGIVIAKSGSGSSMGFGTARPSSGPTYRAPSAPAAPTRPRDSGTPPKSMGFGSARSNETAAPRKPLNSGATNRAYDTAIKQQKSRDVITKSETPPTPKPQVATQRPESKPPAEKAPVPVAKAPDTQPPHRQPWTYKRVETEPPRTYEPRREEYTPAPPVYIPVETPPARVESLPRQAQLPEREIAPGPMITPTTVTENKSSSGFLWGALKFCLAVSFVGIAGFVLIRMMHSDPRDATRTPSAPTSAPKETESDAKLPLGASLGKFIEIRAGSFDTAGLLGSVATPPSIGECKIEAISQLKPKGWQSSDAIFRYHFAIGDDGRSAKRFLQVFRTSSGIEEILYFTRIRERFYIENDDQRRFFSGEDESGVGSREYVLERSALEEVLPADVFARIGEASELVYQRAIGGDQSKIDSVKATEIWLEGHEDKGMRRDIKFMPYARTIGETTLVEHLFISYEVLRDHGGVKQAYVDFMIGLPIIENDILIV